MLALFLAQASAAGKSVDLSAQFPGAAVRNQGATNTCHVFSTIAQLEAAVHRRYGLTIPLSEADLFVRKVIEDPGYYQKVREAMASVTGVEPVYRFVEWGDAKEDIEFAVKNGIARADTAPWPAFSKRYDAFVKGQRAELNAHDKILVMIGGAKTDLHREDSVMSAQEMAIHSDYFASVRQNNFRKIDAEMTADQFSARKTFNEFLKQLEGRTHAEAEDLLLGKEPQRAKDHQLYKTLLQGFRVEQKFYDSKELADDACRAASADRRAALIATFDKGIPAGLSMDVGGLKEWGVDKGPASHAFTVTGYTTDAGGKVFLQSRNSWGGDNPSISEDRFCRISRILKVLGPTE